MAPARRVNASVLFTVPDNTESPGEWVTGRGSPVTEDSSITARSETRVPSTGITSEERTTSRSPTVMSSTATLCTWEVWGSIRWANAGARLSKVSSSRLARWAAQSSRASPPVSISAMMRPAMYSPTSKVATMATTARMSSPQCPARRSLAMCQAVTAITTPMAPIARKPTAVLWPSTVRTRAVVSAATTPRARG